MRHRPGLLLGTDLSGRLLTAAIAGIAVELCMIRVRPRAPH